MSQKVFGVNSRHFAREKFFLFIIAIGLLVPFITMTAQASPDGKNDQSNFTQEINESNCTLRDLYFILPNITASREDALNLLSSPVVLSEKEIQSIKILANTINGIAIHTISSYA
ncbi:MAG: hypothetical protein HQK81_13745 [Desulfovibrionaceae bacterium]|nr:hypothetical protein [Desulfovibrionaceae bacterium]MBF0515107.1 hypothetical protein [Desulfovibrionaceae bacterium]